ncbi:MAG: aminotransferase class III-fold pyridoxal phosphate-dependent enzyme, partial [Rhizobacter sp.]
MARPGAHSARAPFTRGELLNEITPGTFPKKTILANSGAEAVENSIKLSRRFTGRSAIVCFEGGYHGRTLLT